MFAEDQGHRVSESIMNTKYLNDNDHNNTTAFADDTNSRNTIYRKSTDLNVVNGSKPVSTMSVLKNYQGLS